MHFIKKCYEHHNKEALEQELTVVKRIKEGIKQELSNIIKTERDIVLYLNDLKDGNNRLQ